jgi:hypothetical protein
MMFAIVLGTIIGAAGATLFRQWTRGMLTLEEQPTVITPSAFPRLAPSERVPRYTPRLWHRAA